MNTGPFATKSSGKAQSIRATSFTNVPKSAAPPRIKTPKSVPVLPPSIAAVPMLPPSGSSGGAPPCPTCSGKGKVMMNNGTNPMSCNRCNGTGKMGGM